MIKKFKNLYIESDKINCPFLLAASYSKLIKFEGSYIKDKVLHWCFSPKDAAYNLINQLHTKTEPHVPAQDIFDAINTFWLQVTESKKGEKHE